MYSVSDEWRGLLVVQECGLIVILARQDCPPAIWLRALFKMALVNKITPIPYTSPMILIKSQKMYNTGRLLHGHGREFVRMRRTGALPHVSLDAASFPVHFVLTLFVSQERMMPVKYLHHQAISNDHIYTGS
jgi:hypothetical protein